MCWAWLRWAHDGCSPVADDDDSADAINADVNEAYRFFLSLFRKQTIEEGDARLCKLLLDARITTNSILMPILTINDCEQSIYLNGHWMNGVWQFSLDASKHSHGEIAVPVRVEAGRLIHSWRGALKTLDQHHWHGLVPTEVHPEFAKKIWHAYLRRIKNGAPSHQCHRERWKRACVMECRSEQDRCISGERMAEAGNMMPVDSSHIGDMPVPLSSRDQMVKELMEKYPGLTEEEITFMGG
jgi:hypothetical protein